MEDILSFVAEKNLSESSYRETSSGHKMKKYKLPKIEFTKFGGEIKEWLSFWAQFEKIDNGEDLADEDRFHYLRQSTIENSKAREVVDSFPMTGANYPKVINHMKNRFGNKDTLVEVYVRELLKLVLSNAINPTKKMVISTLYDKLEAQLRALESLDVTRDKFAAILFPLVESCLPEELLRAWERHRIVPISTEGDVRADRLTNLMIFLRGEVESEERITLARTGFAEQFKRTKNYDKFQETSTAADLFVRSKGKSKCIFCENPGHFSNQCYVGNKMTLDERKKSVETQKACSICLGKGHQSKSCLLKEKLKCNECGGAHWKLMCKEKPQVTNATDATSPNLATISKEIIPIKTNNLLANPECYEEVVLSTYTMAKRNWL